MINNNSSSSSNNISGVNLTRQTSRSTEDLFTPVIKKQNRWKNKKVSALTTKDDSGHTYSSTSSASSTTSSSAMTNNTANDKSRYEWYENIYCNLTKCGSIVCIKSTVFVDRFSWYGLINWQCWFLNLTRSFSFSITVFCQFDKGQFYYVWFMGLLFRFCSAPINFFREMIWLLR